MRTLMRIVAVVVVVLAIMVGAGLLYVVTTGLKGQPEPGALETRVARAVRALAVPREMKARTNPIGESAEDRKAGLEHFARYCAMCHDNDGSGQKAAIGRGLFPKPPDLRADATARLTDGEMFYIIENGVRFTGMPAFGTGKPDPAGDKQVWQLVAFVRHVPRVTPDEIDWMKSLNPF